MNILGIPCTGLTNIGDKVGNISDEREYGKFFVLEDLDGNLFDIWENHDCELNY